MSERTEESAKSESRVERLIAGASPRRAVQKVAERAAGEHPVLTTEDWLAALAELDDVAAEFQMEDSLLDSYLWHDGSGYVAAELPSGLEDKEDCHLSRLEAASLLDGSITPLASPVALSEVGVDA